MRLSRFRIVALAAVAAVLGACAPLRQGPVADQVKTTVKVDNQAYIDMTIYVMRSTERVRLGLATGASTSSFVIPADVIRSAMPLRFVADPIGGLHASVSEMIYVAPGDEVTMVIPPA